MSLDRKLKSADRRLHRRRECRGAIEWALFNGREHFSGVILNYSQAGAYIESPRELKRGANILLHTGRVIIACENSDGCLPPNATILAEVKWGRTQDEDNDTRTFGAGIRYHL